MDTSASPSVVGGGTVAVVVAPGPRPDPASDRERLLRHREFYLKSPHTIVPGGRALRYRAALGRLTYRAQVALRFAHTPRHTPPDRILDRIEAVSLAAELMSLDLLRVGWEGTMWHIRYGEGASFDDSCVLGPFRPAADVVGRTLWLEDGCGASPVDWADVAEFAAHVNDWMELRPDMIVLAGSSHGPLLTTDGLDAVVRFPDAEPRVGPGDLIAVRSPELGEVSATIGDLTDGRD